MSEELARTRAKRSGNRAVLTKLMNEADDLLQHDETDTPRLKVIVELLGAKLELVKSLDEEIVEVCNIDDIESEIEVAEEINLRVLSRIRAVKDATSQDASDKIKTHTLFLDRGARLDLELKRRYTLEFPRLMINHKVRI